MTTVTTEGTRLRTALLDAAGLAVADAMSRIIAAAAPAPVYAVGGTVRDLLLGCDIVDFDLTVEGNAGFIARTSLPNVTWTTHDRFNTASAEIAATRLDLAMARTETYSSAAALPDVQPSDIEADLRRRDFSINAMALRLTGEPALVDPCGGMADLRAKTVRVLHRMSFVDDPTRIYRAFRYAARLAFALQGATLELLQAALTHVGELSGARIRRELELLLLDEPAGVGMQLAHDAGAIRAAHPALAWPHDGGSALVATDDGSRLPLGFALLCANASPDDISSIIERLRLRREEAAAVAAMPTLRDTARLLRRTNAKPSGVVQLLDRYPVAAVAAFAATVRDAVVVAVVNRYLTEWRHQRTVLHGDDLQALGVPAGPQIEKGLQLIRAARLDGWASDEGDERALALRFAKSIRDSAAAHADIELHFNDN
jgi:tRNA nucleotidyltransferase (CCA-adding enzyme)